MGLLTDISQYTDVFYRHELRIVSAKVKLK